MLAEYRLLVTGLPSPGKTRLVDALRRRLQPSQVSVCVSSDGPQSAELPVLHVHAETDLEAMVEGALPAGNTAKGAELVVAVDWEPLERSVHRVVNRLIERGVAAAMVGA
jgi:hypothetical protein